MIHNVEEVPIAALPIREHSPESAEVFPLFGVVIYTQCSTQQMRKLRAKCEKSASSGRRLCKSLQNVEDLESAPQHRHAAANMGS